LLWPGKRVCIFGAFRIILFEDGEKKKRRGEAGAGRRGGKRGKKGIIQRIASEE